VIDGRRFEAVVFDLFGTLVPEFTRSDFYASVREMARVLGADEAEFEKAWNGSALGRQTGAYPTVRDNIVSLCSSLGVRPDRDALDRAVDARMALYRRSFHPRPGALETLREVKTRGYPVALVSMCAPDAPDLWRASELAPFVDVEVFSCETGLRKPDAAIYGYAADGLGVDPSACLYCGDGAYGELSGAAAVGMTAYLIDDPGVDPSQMLRLEGEDWAGPRVHDLRELLALLPSVR
jgi:putative hydrolase of the HAD superfamily